MIVTVIGNMIIIDFTGRRDVVPYNFYLFFASNSFMNSTNFSTPSTGIAL